MTEYWVVRECQGMAIKRSRLFGDHVVYEHNAKQFGAWYVGPFVDRDSALLWSGPGRRHDRIVPATELSPEMLELLSEHAGLPPRRERYFGAKDLADPAGLTQRLREIALQVQVRYPA